MSPAGIKACYESAVFVTAYGILRFIPIMPRLLHAYNRLHDGINETFIKATDTDQVVSDFILFECKLPVLKSSSLPETV